MIQKLELDKFLLIKTQFGALFDLFKNAPFFMILIKSIAEDLSTTEVVKWILHLNGSFCRLNDVTKIKRINYIDRNFIIEDNKGNIIDFSDVKSYWYRRGDYINKNDFVLTKNDRFDEYHLKHLKVEFKCLFDYFVNYVKKNIYSIGDSNLGTNLNKLLVNEVAKEIGFNIPEFIITSKKTDLWKFIQKHKRIITKAINNTFFLHNAFTTYIAYTQRITQDTIKMIPDNFLATFFQEEVPKSLEIRTFYIKNSVYSMAIFSQIDKKTEVDFRRYNHIKPNRTVPFKLPIDIEIKLVELMNKLHLESGSIDFIYGKDKKIYFLEINPIGQFGMLSYPCNYNLEKKIARHLLNHE